MPANRVIYLFVQKRTGPLVNLNIECLFVRFLARFFLGGIGLSAVSNGATGIVRSGVLRGDVRVGGRQSGDELNVVCATTRFGTRVAANLSRKPDVVTFRPYEW